MHVWFHLRFDGHKYFEEYVNLTTAHTIQYTNHTIVHRFITFSLADGRNSTDSMHFIELLSPAKTIFS